MALNELMKASGNTLLTTAVMTGIGLVTSVLTARILGPEGRGLFSAALLIAMLAAGLAQFGLGNSLVYHRGAGRSFNYRNLLLGSLLFVIAVAVGLAGVGLQLGGEDRLRGQFMLILGLAAAMAAQNYFITLAQLHPGLVFFNLMRLGLVAGNLVLLLVLIAAFHPVDYRKILIAQLIVLAVLAVAGQVWATRELAAGVRVGGVPLKWREVFRYGIAHHGTSVLGLVLLNFDKIALLKMGTMVQFGLYALAFSTSRLIGAVQEAISTALYSRFAGKDPGQLSQGVRAAFRVTLLPMLAVATAGAALSPWLIVLLFGSAFAPMAAPFSILLFECVIGGASWILAQRFNAAGRPGLVFVRQLVSVLPIFMALPFLPEQNIHIWLSILMLMGASLRLGVTLALYPWVLKEPVPGLLPGIADLRRLREMWTRSPAP